MGLSNAVHWTAWFITSMSMMLISIIFMVIAMKFGKILPYSDPTVILWMLVSFATATIKMCFLISVFFSKANIAAACGGIIYFFTYLPYSLTIWFEDQMNYSHKALAVSISIVCFVVWIALKCFNSCWFSKYVFCSRARAYELDRSR